MTVTEESTTGGRSKTKRMGVVTEIRDTEKGRVGNKTGQVLMLISTNKQEVGDPPYALQAKLLEFKGLDSDVLASYKKDLPVKPTLIQTSRKHALSVSCPGNPHCVVVVGKLKSVHKAWMKENAPKDDSDSAAQVVDAASEEEADEDSSPEEEDEQEDGEEVDAAAVSSAGVAAGDDATDDDNDEGLLLHKPGALSLKASPSGGARLAGAAAAPVKRKVSKELGQDQRASAAAESGPSEGPGPPSAAAGSGKKKKSRRMSLKDGDAPQSAKRLKLSLAGIHNH